jgi:Ion channel
MFIIDWLHIIVFLDIFIQMNTIYFERGEPIARFSLIFKKFIRQRLIFDLLCSFNFFLVVYKSIFHQNYSEWLNYIQLPLVLLWTKRIDTIEKNLTDYLQLSEYATYLFKIGKLLVIVVLIAHWMSCVWFLILKFDSEGDTFYISSIISPNDLEHQYVVTFYWIITVMATVGYGDFSPTSTIQRVTSIFFILFSTVVFAYTVNTIGEIYDERMQMDNMKKIKLVELNEYLRNKNITRELTVDMR